MSEAKDNILSGRDMKMRKELIQTEPDGNCQSLFIRFQEDQNRVDFTETNLLTL